MLLLQVKSFWKKKFYFHGVNTQEHFFSSRFSDVFAILGSEVKSL